ncbi:galactoside 2-alpha-L-fucosyltransferase Sec1-like [Cylas formicarius]|uniref:galactoside 2-alpha-L-fucosyltransferase Sec1-like n=1 Tax=Cylas formicarius TaxID=197179 RepID=UPI002958AAEF|nr:galactoside 2-alpha-L-fucosyltransferase Sec1-like [Cylas formicarius]
MTMLTTNNNLLFKATVLALCVISFVHVFLFPLYDVESARGTAKTYADFEQSLCMNNIKRRKVWRLSRCPQYGIVTIMQGGRLGNQMWEYASVWAVARRTGLEPYVPRCIRLKLDQIFEQLTVPAFEEIAHCPVEIGAFVKSIEAWTFTNQSIILPRYSIQPELVLTWVQDIVREFTLRRKLRDKSQQVLRGFVKNSAHVNHTFVGVHVRRTDYIGYLMRKHNARPADITFYLNAMKYFEAKYTNVTFVFVSDDPAWCARKFAHKANVFVASNRHKNTPALDLAILAACNHSIYDYGTFGEWGAILTGGETVYYNLTHHSSAKIGEIMKNWHAL